MLRLKLEATVQNLLQQLKHNTVKERFLYSLWPGLTATTNLIAFNVKSISNSSPIREKKSASVTRISLRDPIYFPKLPLRLWKDNPFCIIWWS